MKNFIPICCLRTANCSAKQVRGAIRKTTAKLHQKSAYQMVSAFHSGREIRTLMAALIYLEKKGFAHPLMSRYSKRYSNLFCNI